MKSNDSNDMSKFSNGDFLVFRHCTLADKWDHPTKRNFRSSFCNLNGSTRFMLLTRGLRSHSKSWSPFFVWHWNSWNFPTVGFPGNLYGRGHCCRQKRQSAWHDRSAERRKKYCCDVAQKKNHLLNWDLDDRKFGKYFSLCLQN